VLYYHLWVRLSTSNLLLFQSPLWYVISKFFNIRPVNSQSYIAADSQSVCLSWCQAPIWDQRTIFPLSSLIIFRQLRVCWCGAASLTRSRVCSFQILLDIANAAFLRSESHGTHEHILLSLFLRLPHPGGQGSCIYFPQEQGSPVIHPRIGLQWILCKGSDYIRLVWNAFHGAYVTLILSVHLGGKKKKKKPWSESARELYRPSDRRLSANWLPTCADRRCHVVSVTDPPGRIFRFSRQKPLLFYQVAPQFVLTRLSGPRSIPTTFFFLVVPGIKPGPPDL
jgi:hypothetical protein